MGMSSMLSLFIIASIVVTDSGLKALAQDHPGAYEPQSTNRSDNRSGFNFDLDDRLPSAAIPTSEGRRLRSRNNGNQHVLAEEGGHSVLSVEPPEDPDENVVKRHVTLVIAVPSVRPDRRKAIRETWWKWADDRVVLRFFTEPPNKAVEGINAKRAAISLAEESSTYGDIVLQDIDPGMNFGLKLLWAMRWMSDNYSFNFFLRLDDDYFICLERLIEELDCLQGKPQWPIFAGYRVCGHKELRAAYTDEAYILISSSIVNRVLAASDLKCSGFGSLTAAAWIKVGGPGNPDGDVAFVHDYRLDHPGNWWKTTKEAKAISSKYSPVCERGLGIHHTYPDRMHMLWMQVVGRTNETQSAGGCTSVFRYEDDGECPLVSRAVDEGDLKRDKFQPCDSYISERKHVWCGHQKC